MENKFCNNKDSSLGKEEVLDITPEEIGGQIEQMVKESTSFEVEEENMENKFCNYKGLSLGKEEVLDITPEEIEAQLEQMVKESVSFEVKEGKSENGDIVNIDFEGFVDGVAFEGGKGEKYDLELGSNSFIPGFEEQLISSKAGSEVDVNVTFPENYHAEQLKGKPAVFKCKIHEVKEKVIPALDDNFAKQQGFETVDQLRETLRMQMQQRNTAKVYNKYFDDVCSYLVLNSELEVNQEQLEVSMQNVLAYYEQSVAQYGINLEQYLQMTGKTMEEFQETLKPEAIRGAKINMILEHIAHEENIVVTEEEVEFELKRIGEYYKLSEEQLKQFKDKNLGEFENEILKQKVFKFVVENL
jgi:trigger factor